MPAHTCASDLSGHGFSRAENNAARSATSEEVRGNPSRVSPASSLENGWIEIFRAGDYGERGRWAPGQLDQLAAAYDPRLHAAPVVLGHPADDAPAYAWVKRLRRAGHSLWAQLEKVDPLFEALLRAGRFAQRSVALYTHFPATGGPYLRHLGFLGAAPPAIKGLAPVRFADAACPARFPVGASVTFAFDEQLSEVEMSEPKSKLEGFLDHLRAFFTPETSPPAVIPSDPESRTAGRGGVEGPAFSERLAALEQRLDNLTGSSSEPVTPPALSGAEGSEAEGRAEGSLLARQQIATFVESLRARGRFPPAYERWGVADFMERLAAADAKSETSRTDIPVCPAADPSTPLRTSKNVCPTTAQEEDVILPVLSEVEGSEAKDRDQEAPLNSLLTWFEAFLTKLPAVIEFQELGGHESRVTSHLSRPVVRFAEPHRGMSIDPASVELAERAEALAAELGISYAEALIRLREERRRTLTTA